MTGMHSSESMRSIEEKKIKHTISYSVVNVSPYSSSPYDLF
jgi:hypothetical protein